MGYGMEKWETHLMVEALRLLVMDVYGELFSKEDLCDIADGLNNLDVDMDTVYGDRIVNATDFLEQMERDTLKK